MKLYIVEQPTYNSERIDLLPSYEPDNFYIDMVDFCIAHKLHVDPLNYSDSGFIVFLHGSNDEGAALNPPSALGAVPSWERGYQFVTFIATRVCQAGGRVVFYSGGTPKCNVQSFRDYLSSAGFDEGHHFAIIELASIYKDHPDLAKSISISKDWRVDQLDRRTIAASPAIVALNILLQGYLAVWAPQKVFEGEPAKVKYAAKVNIANFRCFTSKNDLYLFFPEPGHKHEGFWFDPLSEDYRTTFETLAGKSLRWSAASYNEKAWDLIRNGRSLGEGKRPSDSKVAKVFECAYSEFKALEHGLSCEIELEKIRAALNHDMVMNSFLNTLTCGSSDSDWFVRTPLIIEVWNSLKGAENIEDLEQKKDTVKRSLENWPSVLLALKDFFKNVPKNWGYLGTALFDDEQKKFFEGNESYTVIIDRFVQDFYDIGQKSDDKERELRLREFLTAADKICKKLSEMRLGEGGRFKEYFKKGCA